MPVVEVHLRAVRKHPKKGTYWQLRWTMNGQRDEQTLGYLSPADAEAERVKKEALLRLGVASWPSMPSEPEVELLAREYLHHVDETQPGAPRYRQAETRHCLIIAEHVGDTRASEISEVTLRRLIAGIRADAGERPPKKHTLLAVISTFRRLVRHALDRGRVSRPPPRLTAGVLTDDARPPRELSQSEVRALILAAREHVSEPYARLIEFAAWCPRRPVALFHLRVGHVTAATDPRQPRDQVRIWIERDKAGIGRGWCPLTDPALEALSIQLIELGSREPSALVWPSPSGVAYTSSSVQRELKVAQKAAGLADVTFYDLRRFGCTQVYVSAHGDLKLVQRFSGHRDVSTLVRRYIYAQPGAAEALAPRVTWASTPGHGGTKSGTPSRRRA